MDRSPLAGTVSAAAKFTVDELFVALGGEWPEERVLCGKGLIEKLWQSHAFLGPYPFLDTLSQFEFGGKFYPKYRDHVCHQLKVYLLGLYAYEGCPRLKDLLDSSFSVPASDTAENFAVRWLATAVYHDVGYVLENDQADPVNGEAWKRTCERLNAVLMTPLAYVPGFSGRLRNEDLVQQKNRIFRPEVKVPSDLDQYSEDGETLDLLSLLDHEAVRAGLGARGDSAVVRRYYEYAQKQPLPSRPRFRDHGVTSALMLLYTWREFRRYVSQLATLANEPLVAGVASDIHDLASTLRSSDASEIVRSAAAAMALHNVTPKDWNSDALRRELLNAGVTMSNFQICLSDPKRGTPLAFLLGLTDTLQDWDRPRFRAPEPEDRQIRTDQDMSIAASGGKLLLYFPDDERRFREPASDSGSLFSAARRILHEYLAPTDVDALLAWDDRVPSSGGSDLGETSSITPATSASVMPRTINLVRRSEIERDIERHLEQARHDEVWRAVVLRGMPGTGKSMLAASIARRINTSSQSLGVLWAHIGRPEDNNIETDGRRLTAAVEQWLAELGASRPATISNSLDELLSALKKSLQSSTAVIVLDDVWEPADARRLLSTVGPACRILITTRIPEVASLLGLSELEIPPMSPEEAALLLNRGQPLSASDRDSVDRITKLFGALPLALEIIASLRLRGQSWKRFADFLEGEPSRLRLLRGISTHSVASSEDRKRMNALFSFRLSLERLEPPAREAFLWLGALRAGAVFTPQTIATLCGVSNVEGLRLCAELRSVSLVSETDTGQLSVHDLVRDFAQELLTNSAVDDVPGARLTPAEVHRRLIEAYLARAGGAWAGLRDEDYATTHLTWHMQQSGAERELHDLLEATRADGRNVWYELTWGRGFATDYVHDVELGLDLSRKSLQRGTSDASVALGILLRHGLTLSSALSRITALPGTLLARLVAGGQWRSAATIDCVRLITNPLRRVESFTALLRVVPETARARVFQEAIAGLDQTDEWQRLRLFRDLLTTYMPPRAPTAIDAAFKWQKRLDDQKSREEALVCLIDVFREEIRSDWLRIDLEQDLSARTWFRLLSLDQTLFTPALTSEVRNILVQRLAADDQNTYVLATLASHFPSYEWKQEIERYLTTAISYLDRNESSPSPSSALMMLVPFIRTLSVQDRADLASEVLQFGDRLFQDSFAVADLLRLLNAGERELEAHLRGLLDRADSRWKQIILLEAAAKILAEMTPAVRAVLSAQAMKWASVTSDGNLAGELADLATIMTDIERKQLAALAEDWPPDCQMRVFTALIAVEENEGTAVKLARRVLSQLRAVKDEGMRYETVKAIARALPNEDLDRVQTELALGDAQWLLFGAFKLTKRLSGQPRLRFLGFTMKVIGQIADEYLRSEYLCQVLSLVPESWEKGGETVAAGLSTAYWRARALIERMKTAPEAERRLLLQDVHFLIDDKNWTESKPDRYELLARLAAADSSQKDMFFDRIWIEVSARPEMYTQTLRVLAQQGLVTPSQAESLQNGFSELWYFVDCLTPAINARLAEDIADRLEGEAKFRYNNVERALPKLTSKLVELGRIDRAFLLWRRTAKFSFLGQGLAVLHPHLDGPKLDAALKKITARRADGHFSENEWARGAALEEWCEAAGRLNHPDAETLALAVEVPAHRLGAIARLAGVLDPARRERLLVEAIRLTTNLADDERRKCIGSLVLALTHCSVPFATRLWLEVEPRIWKQERRFAIQELYEWTPLLEHIGGPAVLAHLAEGIETAATAWS